MAAGGSHIFRWRADGDGDRFNYVERGIAVNAGERKAEMLDGASQAEEAPDTYDATGFLRRAARVEVASNVVNGGSHIREGWRADGDVNDWDYVELDGNVNAGGRKVLDGARDAFLGSEGLRNPGFVEAYDTVDKPDSDVTVDAAIEPDGSVQRRDYVRWRRAVNGRPEGEERSAVRVD